MPIGNEMFPNIFIDNIEVFDNKVEFMVFVFDRINKPTWTKNNKIKDKLMLSVSLEGDIEKTVKYDVGLFPTDKLSGDDLYYEGSVAYYKKITFMVQNNSKIMDLSIMCNLFLRDTSLKGPSISEPVVSGGTVITSTVAYYKGNAQYYGAVHSHNGTIMEGAVHSDVPHAVLDVRDVHNLKIKDYRSENYKHSSLEKRNINTNLPIFSDLFVSYDEETTHKSIFFINLLEIVRRDTKFGTYFDSISSTIRNRMLNNVEIKSIIITRNQVNTNYNNDGIYNPIKKDSFLIGFERGKSLSELREDDSLKNNLRYIYHDYGNTILGIEFIDKDLNDKSFGTYQYSIDITFSDKTVEVLRDLTQRIDSLINQARSYLYKLNNPKYYNYNLKKSKNLFYTSEQGSGSFIFLANELAFLKSVVFDLTDDSIREEKIRYYNLLEPKSCTIESVSFYLKEATKIYNEFVSLFGKNRVVGGKFEKPASTKSNSYIQNVINIKHVFKQLIKPDSSKVYYSFNSEEITANNFKQTMSRSPLLFGSRNRQEFLKSNKGKMELKDKMNKKIKGSTVNSLSVGRVVMLPKKKKENFINTTEYLGKDSKFVSFESQEKCETIKPDTEAFVDVSLSIVADSDDIIEEVSNISNKIEFLEGFEIAANGSLLLKKPIWRDIDSQGNFSQGSTIFIKQTPTQGRKKVIDFSFPNEYKLLNNLNSRNINNPIENSDNVITEIDTATRTVDLFRTSNGLSNNDDDISAVPAQNTRRQTSQPQSSRSIQQPTSTSSTQMPMATSTSTTGGGY